MPNFIKLVWNEQIKLFAKKSSWVMMGLLLVLVIANGVMTEFFSGENFEKEYGDNWRDELTEENAQLQAEMEDDEFGGFMQDIEIEQNNFYLAEDIKPQPYDGWQFTQENVLLVTLISLFTIIIAASIVSNEFKWGTIKLLLIRPITRSKILLAKYVSVFVFTGILLLVLLVSSLLVGSILFGLNGISPNFVTQTAAGYVEQNATVAILRDYGLALVSLVMMATFAFMISTLFRSSGMAIGLSIFLMMAGSAIVAFLAKYSWAKFILFANTNLSQYVNGNQPMIEGMTLTFSIIMLVIYLIIFLVVSFVTFTKRDVA